MTTPAQPNPVNDALARIYERALQRAQEAQEQQKTTSENSLAATSGVVTSDKEHVSNGQSLPE